LVRQQYVRDEHSSNAVGQKPRVIVARMTKDLQLAIRGKPGPLKGFGGPVEYPESKLI
jgi:hypothetical protein